MVATTAIINIGAGLAVQYAGKPESIEELGEMTLDEIPAITSPIKEDFNEVQRRRV